MSFQHLIAGVCGLVAVAGLATCAAAGEYTPPLRRFRDLKVYTTSAPEKGRPERIVERTQFVNEGKTTLNIAARLGECRLLGFDGARFSGVVKPGKSVVWKWSFSSKPGLQRQILTGEIEINGQRERDLFISVMGQDPPDLPEKGLEKITEQARVVATYVPRRQESIDAELKLREAQKAKPKLVLAAAGRTDYVIVVEAAVAEQGEVIGDLQRVVKLQSGAELKVAEKAVGPAIILRKADLGTAAKGLQDAYRLKTEGKNIIIEAPSPEGLRSGVYGLLTDHLGAHWFQPNALGEEIPIPKDKTVRLPNMNELRGSRWQSCTGASWGWAPAWDRRNRTIVNGGRICFGHAWENYINPTKYPYDQFPQYYAKDREGNLLNQSPPGNFCSTNPEVIDIVAKAVNDSFRQNPNAIVASLDPNDYQPLCLCDRCKALDKQYGVTVDGWTESSDRLLHFSKEVHDRLEPQFKDKYLGILIYGFQVELPKSAKPHPHHAGMICDMLWIYDHSRPWNDPTSSLNRKFYDLLKGWGELLTQFGYYDYYGHWTFYGPWSLANKMREDIPAFYDLGGTYLVLEAQPTLGTQGLNHYVLSQLIWDLDADVDLAMERFFRQYYGPAAGPMRDYWLTVERYYALERPSVTTPPRAAMRPEFWRDLSRCLARAKKIVSTLPEDQKRFADRVTFASVTFDYSRLRFEYEMTYGFRAQEMRKRVDHAAGIAFLQKHGAYFVDMETKYCGQDGYWPMMLRECFYLNPDAEIKKHENPAAAAAQAAALSGYSDEETFARIRETMTEIYDLPKDDWQFALDPHDVGEKQAWFNIEPKDEDVHRISIGKFWQEQGVEYVGTAWYRKVFTAPAIEPGKKVFVVIGAADDFAKVWLNGQYVGEQHLEVGIGWKTPFALDVTQVIKPGEENTLIVQIGDVGGLSGLWKSIKLFSSQ